MNVPKIGTTRQNVPFALWITHPTSKDARLSNKFLKNLLQKFHLLPRLLITTLNPTPKHMLNAEAINNQVTHTENPSAIFSQFISNLNALISPLMTLLSSVLKALVVKNII